MNAAVNPLRVGLAGIGTVGGGTWAVLARNADEIRRRAGRAVQITAVADLDAAKVQATTGGKARFVPDAMLLARDPEIDVVVELIGGYGFAKEVGKELVKAEGEALPREAKAGRGSEKRSLAAKVPAARGAQLEQSDAGSGIGGVIGSVG